MAASIMKYILHLSESSFCDGEEERMEKREQEMSLAEQEEPPVPVEISEFRIEIEGRTDLANEWF